jgi:DNA-binding XRE family transcriptional regulator
MRIAGKLTEISFTVPSTDAVRVCKAVDSVLELATFTRPLNEDGDQLYSGEEVFPESSPGDRLRGLRAREDLTQKAFAERLGIRQHHIAEMEKGKRPVTLGMAKRIGEAFNISYKVFV